MHVTCFDQNTTRTIRKAQKLGEIWKIKKTKTKHSSNYFSVFNFSSTALIIAVSFRGRSQKIYLTPPSLLWHVLPLIMVVWVLQFLFILVTLTLWTFVFSETGGGISFAMTTLRANLQFAVTKCPTSCLH